MTELDGVSWMVSAGNVGSAFLAGPFLLLVMRHLLHWSDRRCVAMALIGWTLLFVAQVLLWRWFGFKAGYPGFKYLQPWMLPVSAANFFASMWLTRLAKGTVNAHSTGHRMPAWRAWRYLLTRTHGRAGQLR